jgi:tetratricopeptide (TPR) repeat protein
MHRRVELLRNRCRRRLVAMVSSPRRSLVSWLALLLLLLVIAVGHASIHRRDERPAVIAWERAYDEALRSYSAGDYRSTVDELNKVLAAVPGERSVIQLRIAANLELGRYGQTIPDLTTLIQTDPTNADLRLERGIMYERVQRADRALVDFETVITLAPTNPSGYEWAGLVNFERGHLDTATRQLNHALSLSPHDGKIARELASVMASANRLPVALALYDAAIQLNPSDARAYAERAAVLRHVGADTATIPDLQQVLVLTDDVQQQQWAVRLLGTITGTESHPDGATG